MNKTVTVNISGFVFYIEEEAFNVLSTYLNRIKSIFQSEESSDEIIDDVESRIGELFKERLEGSREVVTMNDVEEMIKVMGKPEDYIEDGSFSNANQTYSHAAYSDSSSQSKKLYRDEDDKVIGGVCAGLAHYFGLDAVLVRILLVISFFMFGFGIGIYIILWIIIPKAESTSDKLRMRGEPINLDSIKKKVNDIAGETDLTKASNGFQNFLDSLGKLFTAAAKVIGKVAAVFFSFLFGVIGFSLLIGLIALIISPESSMNISGLDLELGQIIDLAFPGTLTFYLLTIGILLLFLAPIIGLFYLAIRILTGERYRSKSLVMTVITAFVIGIVMSSAGGISFAKHYSVHGDIEETDVISDSGIEDLHVMLFEDDIFHSSINLDEHHSNNSLELVKVKDGYLYNGRLIELRTRSSATDDYIINVLKESQGRREIDAINYAENINYRMKLNGDTLYLSPYFFTPQEDKFRAQRIEVEIAVPDNKKITLDKNTRRIDTRGIRSGKSYIYIDGRKEVDGFLERETDEKESGHHKITIEKEDGNLEIDIQTDIDEDNEETIQSISI